MENNLKFDIIKEIIDKWDPVDLLRIGAPSYEYNEEIKGIVVLLNFDIEIDSLINYLHLVFTERFGLENTKAASILECEKIAKKILNKTKDIKT